MAPACVLLGRTVVFRDYPSQADPPVTAVGGGDDGGGAATASGVVGAASSEAEPPLSVLDAMEEAEAKYLLAMKSDLQVVDFPGVSRFTMVRPPSSDPTPEYGRHRPHCFVAAGDSNLIVLYAGSYTPSSSKGFYLLVDTASSSLSTIPGVREDPHSQHYRCAGYGTVIMARQDGAFVLAELLFAFNLRAKTARAMLCLWHSSSEQRTSEWVYKFGHLPAQVFYPWRLHTSFPVQSRNLFCWVDLLHGLLLLDLGRQHCESEVDSALDLPGMSFIPLPDGCHISERNRGALHPQDFRNMACVDGTIKFIAMDGFVLNGIPIALVTYTLHLDGPSPSWTKDTELRLEHLWADETFISIGVPRMKPVFPILSTQEHDVVYLAIPATHLDDVDGYKIRRVEYMLSVDMRNKRVISATQNNCPRIWTALRHLLVFHASQQGSKNHQVIKMCLYFDKCLLLLECGGSNWDGAKWKKGEV
ncbi:hypothetical protein HU200_046798 [Digitaria exilis]|uniref:DUF1618 domain-containing protein n=1 Tax=Digitaria exilis TaxID=1010633 RepID=A0A835AYE6_9POAL|nr:hypothetical protein HU200_046798 [Digitaria exilis]